MQASIEQAGLVEQFFLLLLPHDEYEHCQKLKLHGALNAQDNAPKINKYVYDSKVLL